MFSVPELKSTREEGAGKKLRLTNARAARACTRLAWAPRTPQSPRWRSPAFRTAAGAANGRLGDSWSSGRWGGDAAPPRRPAGCGTGGDKNVLLTWPPVRVQALGSLPAAQPVHVPSSPRRQWRPPCTGTGASGRSGRCQAHGCSREQFAVHPAADELPTFRRPRRCPQSPAPTTASPTGSASPSPPVGLVALVLSPEGGTLLARRTEGPWEGLRQQASKGRTRQQVTRWPVGLLLAGKSMATTVIVVSVRKPRSAESA